MKTRSFLPLVLSFSVFVLAGLAETNPAEQNEKHPGRPIRVTSSLEAVIPSQLRSLLMDKPFAQFVVTVEPDGKLADYVAIAATHYGLLPKAVEVLQRTRFEPALAEGKPVQASVTLNVTFYDPEQRAYFSGVGVMPMGGSVNDAAERRMYTLAKDRFAYRCSQVSELDHPIAVQEGKLMVLADRDGNLASGSVVVEFYIDADGVPRVPRVLKADNETVALSALLTLKHTRYQPLTRHGAPTCIKVRQPMNYTASASDINGSAG